ncbi:hypothetical protein ACJ41O_004688 [Fusarium nematophilum]
MNTKNWNDRADKDLFFTILSVKNIGVISGAEWTTIGNHMRSLGYGFTNEGCRQHFQGLRRAQNKAESNGGLNENARKVDPTLNPITRRPGPGRGRPRKQPPAPVAGAPGESAPNPALAPMAATGPPHPTPIQTYGVPPGQAILPQPIPTTTSGPPATPAPTPTAAPAGQMPPAGGPVTYPSPPRNPELPQNPPHLHPLQHGQQPQDLQQEAPRGLGEATDTSSTSQPLPTEQNDPPPSGSAEPPEPPAPASEDADGEPDTEEPAAKRPRLSSPDPTKEVLDDEAVLALAAHSGSTDPFPSDFATYGEA